MSFLALVLAVVLIIWGIALLTRSIPDSPWYAYVSILVIALMVIFPGARL